MRGVCGQRGFGHRGEFFGVDVGGMSRGGRVGISVVVISAVLMSGVFLLAFAPGMWWLVTIYGWVVFPALGLLGGGVSGKSFGTLAPDRFAVPALFEPKIADSESVSESGERQLLIAMERSGGGISAARAAIETRLSVAEAEELLSGLAKDGYIEVRVANGGLVYSMWDGEE